MTHWDAVDPAVSLAHYQLATSLRDDEWVAFLSGERLSGVITLPVPAAPPADVECQFLGASGRDALLEVSPFYSAVRRLARRRFTYLLDFGCGLGRITRLFLRDADAILGVDVDEDCVGFCRLAMPFCSFARCNAEPPLRVHDGEISGVVAYSVFSHLPERLFLGWLREFARVLAPGGLLCFTTLKTAHVTRWHELVETNSHYRRAWENRVSSDGFLYVPIGGGSEERPPSLYGEAVITEPYVRMAGTQEGFVVEEFREDLLPQAFVALRKQ